LTKFYANFLLALAISVTFILWPQPVVVILSDAKEVEGEELFLEKKGFSGSSVMHLDPADLNDTQQKHEDDVIPRYSVGIAGDDYSSVNNEFISSPIMQAFQQGEITYLDNFPKWLLEQPIPEMTVEQLVMALKETEGISSTLYDVQKRADLAKLRIAIEFQIAEKNANPNNFSDRVGVYIRLKKYAPYGEGDSINLETIDELKQRLFASDSAERVDHYLSVFVEGEL
jgi:hypothetical protein